jgi:arginine repressor
MARYEIKQIIGTIAGDDTVLVIAKSSNGGAVAKRELLSFFDKNIGASGRVGKK